VPSYTLRLRAVTVGWSDLEDSDPDARIARGALRPGIGYELVEPVFQLRADAEARGGADGSMLRERFARARAALALELVDARGHSVRATDIVVIPGATPLLEARVEDERFWRGWETGSAS
jgi:hypothetical protein